MNVSNAAARVYAKALFDLALQSQALGSISDDLHAVQEALGGLDPEAIGGIRVNLGDFVLDGTIRRALSDMRRSLVAPYERG